MATQAVERCPLLIGGRWIRDDETPTAPVHNPSTGEEIARVPLCGADEVQRAVEAAAAAFPAWRDRPVLERARLLFRYRALLVDEFDSIARLICREEGKTLEEARGSLQRGIEVVEFACGAPALLMGESLHDLGRGVDGETEREPLGVCVGITPFNFPAMVPLWMFPLALVCGNTFVLKPSEQVPLTAVRLVELLAQAGLPDGVLNLVHGRREAVDGLLADPRVRAVSFVGSSAVARRVYETASVKGKRVQAAGGAKNYMVVMPDADLTLMGRAVRTSAFGCAGERCMAGSVVVTVGPGREAVTRALVQTAAEVRVGRTDRDAVAATMGPLVSRAHLERVLRWVEGALDEGATLALDGRDVEVTDAPRGFFLGPTILDGVGPGMRIAREEVFGPVLSLMEAADLGTAIDLINASGYGNGATIFTASGAAARQFRAEVNVGMIGVNVGVPAAQALFPFAGRGGSFFGDLHVQGREGLAFYTQAKVTMTRWDN